MPSLASSHTHGTWGVRLIDAIWDKGDMEA